MSRFKHAKNAVKLLISALLLFLLLRNVAMGEILTAVSSVNLGYYALAFGFVLVQQLILTSRYHLFFKNTEIETSFAHLFKINFVSMFYGAFLPAAVGPAAIRWLKVTRGGQGKVFAAYVTLIERILFVLSIFIFCLGPLLSFNQSEDVKNFAMKILPLVLAGIVLCFLVLGALLFNLPLPKRPAWLNAFNDLKRKIGFFDAIKVLGFCLLWQFAYLLQVVCICKASGLNVPLISLAWVSALSLFLQSLPFSFLGLGIREGVLAYLFKLIGLTAENGVFVGLLLFSQLLLVCLIGGLFTVSEVFAKDAGEVK